LAPGDRSLSLPGTHAMLALWHLNEAWKRWVDIQESVADAIVTEIKFILRQWPLSSVLARNTSAEELEAFENLVSFALRVKKLSRSLCAVGRRIFRFSSAHSLFRSLQFKRRPRRSFCLVIHPSRHSKN